jgi:transcriptional regulator with XRE-family HTH domain
MKGKTLRTIRKHLGLTQVKLAKAIGVTGNTVARWERGELPIREPMARLIQRLEAEGT